MTSFIFWFLPGNQPRYLLVSGFYFLTQHGALPYPFLSLPPSVPVARYKGGGIHHIAHLYPGYMRRSCPLLPLLLRDLKAAWGKARWGQQQRCSGSLSTHSEKDVAHVFKCL